MYTYTHTVIIQRAPAEMSASHKPGKGYSFGNLQYLQRCSFS